MDIKMLLRSLFTISVISAFFAVADEQVSNYKILGFKESLTESVDVSGGVLVSYQFEGNLSNPQTDSLYIAVPKLESQVKIKILSIDGQYSANFTLSLSGEKSKWMKIAIPSKYQKRLATYDAKDLAVYAYHEVPSKRRKKLWNVLPTAWGVPIVANKTSTLIRLVTLPGPYTHFRTHRTVLDLVFPLLLEKKKNNNNTHT